MQRWFPRRGGPCGLSGDTAVACNREENEISRNERPEDVITNKCPPGRIEI